MSAAQMHAADRHDAAGYYDALHGHAADPGLWARSAAYREAYNATRGRLTSS